MEAKILGNITLVNDDCMNFLHSLSDNAFDLAIVDPPYFAGPNKRQYYGSEVSIHQVRRVKYNVIEKWDIPTIEYWADSEGAKIELTFAIKKGMYVIEQQKQP